MRRAAADVAALSSLVEAETLSDTEADVSCTGAGMGRR
ncbi:MAG: hypothetical protein AVDCRST_MAG01-01-1254 [uncultured Rubrobacteraceae bacterium]|uniref:Uncharacterized protein n=1 Tax=uncultured Rubrobacteraceae bacterium TaxID=349277 RepID=A0A6J4P7A8_9ACTN|nr:MAG: hypothetical protein AVDCRST_MAG01-01-1254 [uncultured Rubrobacteraceae bacterium]